MTHGSRRAWRHSGCGDGRKVVPLKVSGAEVEEFVLDDGAADEAAKLLAPIEWLDLRGRPVTVAILHGDDGEGVCAPRALSRSK